MGGVRATIKDAAAADQLRMCLKSTHQMHGRDEGTAGFSVNGGICHIMIGEGTIVP